MKHKRIVEVPARQLEHISHITCDICNKDIEPREMYEMAECTVSRKVGTCYPEGSTWTKTEFDLCLACFNAHVLNHLVSLGAIPTDSDYSD